MQIRLTHARFGDELIRYLTSMGFDVRECGYDTIRVETVDDARADVVREQLRLYLQVWEATRAGVSAVIDDDSIDTAAS
jgi:hypothetical protein